MLGFTAIEVTNLDMSDSLNMRKGYCVWIDADASEDHEKARSKRVILEDILTSSDPICDVPMFLYDGAGELPMA